MGGERSADVCTPVCKKMPVGEGVLYTHVYGRQEARRAWGIESTTLLQVPGYPLETGKNKKQVKIQLTS